MTQAERLSASFRDPSGFLFFRSGVLYRQINRACEKDYARLMDSGLYEKLVKAGLLIPHVESDQLPAEFDLAERSRSAVAAQHVRGHRHDLGLEFGGAGPHVRVEGIALRVERVDLVEKLDVTLVAVIDRAGDEAVLPGFLLVVAHGLHVAENVRAGASRFGDLCERGEFTLVRFDRTFQSVHHAVIFFFDSLTDTGDGFEGLFGLLEEEVF